MARIDEIRNALDKKWVKFSQLPQKDKDIYMNYGKSIGVDTSQVPAPKAKPTGLTQEQKNIIEQAKRLSPEQISKGLTKQEQKFNVPAIGTEKLQSEMSPLKRVAGTLTRTGAGIVESGVNVPASIAGGLATVTEGVTGGRTDLGLRKISDPLFKLSKQLGSVKQFTPQATSKAEEFVFDTLPSATVDILAKGSTGLFAPTTYITSAVGNAYENGPIVDKFGNELTEKERRDRASIVGGITGPAEFLGDKLALAGYKPSLGTRGIINNIKNASLGEGASGVTESLLTDIYDVKANLTDKSNKKIIKDALMSGIEEALVGGIFSGAKIGATFLNSKGEQVPASQLTEQEAEQNIERIAKELNITPVTLISEAQKSINRQMSEVDKAKTEYDIAKKEYNDFRNQMKKSTTTKADIAIRNELADKANKAKNFFDSTKAVLEQRKQSPIQEDGVDTTQMQTKDITNVPVEVEKTIKNEINNLNTNEELQNRLVEIEKQIAETQDNQLKLDLQFFADEIKQKMSRLGVIDTAKKSKIVSPEIKEQLTIKESPQKSNIKTLESARKLIAKGGEDVAFDDYINDRVDDRVVRNAMAIDLVRKFSKKGDVDKAKQILNKLAVDAKQAGQEGQILSLMSKMGTDGQIIHAQQTIDEVNKEIEKYNQKERLIPRKDVKQLKIEPINDKALRKDLELVNETFDDNAQKLREFIIKNSGITFVNKKVAKDIINSIDLDIEQLKSKALATIYKKHIFDKIPKAIGQKISLAQAIGHLTGSTTFFRNILSNEASFSINQFDKKLGRVIDRAIAKSTDSKRVIGEEISKEKKKEIKGKAREKAKEVKLDVLLGIANQMNEMQKYLDTGGASDLGKTTDLDKKGTTFKNKLGVAAEKQLALSLVVPDERMKEKTRLTMQEELKSLNDGKLTQEMKDDADMEAKYVTFQDDSWASKFLTDGKKWLNQVGIKGFGLGDLVNKYTKVPGNIITRKLEYSPAGLVKAVFGMKTILGKKNMSDTQKRKAIMHLSKGMTGSMLFGLGALLKEIDLLVDEDEKGEAISQLMKDAGLSGMSFNASALKRMLKGEDPDLQSGDTLIRANFLDPFTGAINQGGVWLDFLKGNKKLGGTILKSGEDLIDMPSLYTINRVITEAQRVKNSSEDGFGFVDVATIPLTEAIPGFIPNPIRQTTATFDQATRDSFDSDQWKQAYKKVKQSIPGVSKTLEPSITAQGKTKTRSTDNKVVDFIKTWGPVRVTKFRPLPALDKLSKISELEGGEKHLPLRFPPKKVGKHKLNDKEKTLYMKEYAKGMTQYFQTLKSETVNENNARALKNKLGSLNSEAKKRAEAKIGVLPKVKTNKIPKKLKIIPRLK